MGLIVILSLVLLLMSPAASLAQWSATTDATMLYTDNVFELSAARRLSLSEDPSQPAIHFTAPPFSFGQPLPVSCKAYLGKRSGITRESIHAGGR